MKKAIVSLGFLWNYVSTYWKALLFVAIFMVASTYLQVLGPKLMGESIDSMTSYVSSEIAKTSMDEMEAQMLSGEGLTQEQKDFISGNEDIEQETKDLLLTATPEELQSYQEYSNYMFKVIEMSPQNILDGAGFNEAQIEEINNTEEINQMQKQMLLMTPNDTLQTTYQNRIDSLVTQENVDQNYSEFLMSLMKMIFAIVLSVIGMFIYNLLMVAVAGKSTRDMRRGLFGKMQQLSINFYDKSNDGDLLSKFTNDIDNISNAMNQSLVQILSQIVMLFAIVWMMVSDDNSTAVIMGFEINNVLVWTMLIFAVVALVIAGFIIRKAHIYVSKQQEKLGVLNGFIDERISGQKVVISYGLEQETIDGFNQYNDDLTDTAIKGQIYSGILMPMMNGIGLVNLGVLVFLGATYVSQGIMTVGLLVAFIQYSQRFFQPLAQIVSQYNMVELAVTGAERVKEVFDEPIEVHDVENPIRIDGIEGVVELKNVDFSYIEGKPVLKDVSIKVEKGKMIALVGPTGSGKTTVMNLMNRFYDINGGEITFDGQSIHDIHIDDLRRNVGIVLQESVLFSGTIFENIAYGKENATKEEVVNAAKTANIHEFIMTLEDGYETQVNNNSSVFSTGQKQLMSIARTIITDPDLLILDEATSNVDTVTEAKIQKAMENVLEGRTSFVIAHRLKTILNADEIIVLKDGEIIEQGPHEQLLKENGFYAELYNNQFVVE
jgi:ATP-binding cassette subfamily B multidrug efflux pump